MLTFSPQRQADLAAALARVQEQIAQTAQDTSGARTIDSPEPELLVVTKFFPASDVAALYQLGVRQVGENRDQEAGPKAQELAQELGEGQSMRWAFIGQAQTNKAKSIVRYASSVQSLDRPSLAQALSKAYLNQLARYESEDGPAPAALAEGGLSCLIQVNLDLSQQASAGQAAWGARGGADPSQILELANLVADLPGLKLGGLMAVAPLGQDPAPAFERLYGYSQQLQAEFPQAKQISAGMSGDLAQAIRWGSTQVRVGSQIMGPRPAATSA